MRGAHARPRPRPRRPDRRHVHRDRLRRRAGGRRGGARGDERRRAGGPSHHGRRRRRPAAADAAVNPLFTFRIAALAILRNKVRSFLTALGIIIGVGAGDRDDGDRRGRQEDDRGPVLGDGHQPAHRAARLHHLGRRPRRLGHGGLAHLGRPQGHPDADQQRRRRRALAAQLGHRPRRGPELDHHHLRHDAGLLHGAQLARRERRRDDPSPTWRAAPRSSSSAAPWSTSSSGRAATRWGSRCASRTSPSRWWASPRSRASRPRGRTTTTPSSSPCTTFMAKIQGGLQAYINGQIMVAATSSQTVAQGAAGRDRPAPRAAPHPPRRGGRLQHPEPRRDGRRPGGGDQDHDHPARLASPPSRWSWAASGS